MCSLCKGIGLRYWSILLLVFNSNKFLLAIFVTTDNEQCYYTHFTQKVKSYKVSTVHQGQGQNDGESPKSKSSETQIYVILLLITFGFWILTTPNYAMFLYAILYDFEQSPQAFAGYHLFYNVLRQTYYTNHAINFYLYVICGQKFRTDLVKLFKSTETKSVGNSDGSSKISVISA